MNRLNLPGYTQIAFRILVSFRKYSSHEEDTAKGVKMWILDFDVFPVIV